LIAMTCAKEDVAWHSQASPLPVLSNSLRDCLRKWMGCVIARRPEHAMLSVKIETRGSWIPVVVCGPRIKYGAGSPGMTG